MWGSDPSAHPTASLLTSRVQRPRQQQDGQQESLWVLHGLEDAPGVRL